MPIHHRTWFPFLLVGLTFSLLLLVVFVYGQKQNTASSREDIAEASVKITDEAYVAAASRVMSGFVARFDAAENDAARLALAEQTQGEWLALKVPGARRATHLNTALSLHLLRQGAQGDAVALVEGRQRLETVLEQEPWLR
jgi:hypothetical protein